MKYLSKSQWKQVQQNVEKGQEQSKRIVVDINDEFCYIDYIDMDSDDEPVIGIVSIHSYLLGTVHELLYNYLGDEVGTEIFLSEIKEDERNAVLRKLMTNEQIPVRFFVTDVEYDENLEEDDRKIENAELLTVEVIPQGRTIPKNHIVELAYKNKKYKVK